MNSTAKVVLGGVGFFIGGLALYWEVHAKEVLDVRFFIGFLLAGFVPLGSYFVGLSQKAPWDNKQ